MEAIILFVLRDRERAGELARALFVAGGFLFIAGAVGNFVMKASAAAIVLAGKPAPIALSELYPELPLFWVPEGQIGYSVAALLVMAGLWLGRVVRRLSPY